MRPFEISVIFHFLFSAMIFRCDMQQPPTGNCQSEKRLQYAFWPLNKANLVNDISCHRINTTYFNRGVTPSFRPGPNGEADGSLVIGPGLDDFVSVADDRVALTGQSFTFAAFVLTSSRNIQIVNYRDPRYELHWTGNTPAFNQTYMQGPAFVDQVNGFTGNCSFAGWQFVAASFDSTTKQFGLFCDKSRIAVVPGSPDYTMNTPSQFLVGRELSFSLIVSFRISCLSLNMEYLSVEDLLQMKARCLEGQPSSTTPQSTSGQTTGTTKIEATSPALATCGLPPTLVHGSIRSATFDYEHSEHSEPSRPGHYIIYQCNRPRVLIGESTVRCQSTGWSRLPGCTPPTPNCPGPKQMWYAFWPLNATHGIEDISCHKMNTTYMNLASEPKFGEGPNGHQGGSLVIGPDATDFLSVNDERAIVMSSLSFTFAAFVFSTSSAFPVINYQPKYPGVSLEWTGSSPKDNLMTLSGLLLTSPYHFANCSFAGWQFIAIRFYHDSKTFDAFCNESSLAGPYGYDKKLFVAPGLLIGQDGAGLAQTTIVPFRISCLSLHLEALSDGDLLEMKARCLEAPLPSTVPQTTPRLTTKASLTAGESSPAPTAPETLSTRSPTTLTEAAQRMGSLQTTSPSESHTFDVDGTIEVRGNITLPGGKTVSSESWPPELSDTTSALFSSVASAMTLVIEATFANYSIESVSITGFRKGSIIADYIVALRSLTQLTEAEIQKRVNQALKEIKEDGHGHFEGVDASDLASVDIKAVRSAIAAHTTPRLDRNVASAPEPRPIVAVVLCILVQNLFGILH